MGYTPLKTPTTNVQTEPYDNIELHSYSSHPANLYLPPPGHPPDSSSNNPDLKRDSKALFRSDQPRVPQWPVQSQRVATLTPLRWFIVFFDVILASTPIMFITLALIAARIDGEEISEYGTHLNQVLLFSPTIFPIIFAALMGRCFKHVGLFRAERGIALGRLEQFVGCQSLFSALERQIALRSWSILGMLMTLVWLLSPLGGQSALRLLDREPKSIHSVRSVDFLNPDSVQSSMLMGASAMNSGRSTFTSVFLAALLSSSKYQDTPMDLWGNVKIPSYSAIQDNSSDDWKPVPDDDHLKVTYASLIGIPVANVPNSGKSYFNVQTRQWDITCDSNREISLEESGIVNQSDATWRFNYTETKCQGYPCEFKLFSLDSIGNYSAAHCKMSLGNFEATINCNRTSCQATSMKKLDLFSGGYTEDADDFTRSGMMVTGSQNLPTVDNYHVTARGARDSTNMEKWMSDPYNFNIGAFGGNVDLYKLPPKLLGERLTIIWNTFWQSTYATPALGGNLPKNLTSLSDTDALLTFNSSRTDFVDESKTVYRTNWRFFALLLVSSIILQIAAYVGLVLKYTTLAPDIIGYASSLTLLNPYVPVPTGGTTMNGLERAALLYHLPIRIGDVCANEPVGAIAVARADEGRVGKLDRKRWYI